MAYYAIAVFRRKRGLYRFYNGGLMRCGLRLVPTQAIKIADRGYVIVHGKIAFAGGSAEELNNNELIRKFYLGLQAEVLSGAI
jgi:hypothetical protein